MKYHVVADVKWHPHVKGRHAQASSFNSKSYGDGQMAMGAGASVYWKPIVIDVHGGHDCMVIVFYSELRLVCN